MKRVSLNRESSGLKDDIRVYLRLLRLLNQYNRGWLVILLGAFLDGALPFVAIWLSAMLLDALYAAFCHQAEEHHVVGDAAPDGGAPDEKDHGNGLRPDGKRESARPAGEAG